MKTITHLKSRINELSSVGVVLLNQYSDAPLSIKRQGLGKNLRCWKGQGFKSQLSNPVVVQTITVTGLAQYSPVLEATNLKHLPDLPAGQVHVEFMHQLVDLFNVQQAISVLVSLLKGLFHPAANASRKRTRVWSPPGGGRQSSWAGPGQELSSGK